MPSVAQIGVPDLLETACQVEARGELVSERLVVDKTIRVCRADRLLVEMLSSQLVAFYSRDLCAYQRGTVFEVFRTIFCPDLESLVVLDQGHPGAPGDPGLRQSPKMPLEKAHCKSDIPLPQNTG